MSKKYMDFVTSGSRKPKVASKKAEVIMPKKEPKTLPKTASRKVVSEAPKKTVSATSSARVRTFSNEKDLSLGQIEDLNQKFVRTDVPKRPLSSAGATEVDLTAIKSKKIKNESVTEASKTKNKELAVSSKKKTFNVPKPQFVNQEKVIKRPLSKNVYQKNVKEVDEVKGPVTIIAKPEKDPHINIVVTIIITIILGAAAGTVAFLLLPK